MFRKITATFWLFVGFFVLIILILSKFIFNNPAYPESNLRLVIVNSLIMSLVIVSAFLYSANHSNDKQMPASSQKIDPEIVIGKIILQSGTLTEKDGLPHGYTIEFENANHPPVISTVDSKDLHYLRNSGMFFTVVKFGNGKVVIESRNHSVDLREVKDNFKILVKYLDETKISFG